MKRGEFNWTTGIFIIGYHLLVFALFPLYVIFWEVSLGLIITTIVAGSIANFTITAGYHRYFAHRTYELSKMGEKIVLLLGALSVQGSVLQWAHDHRIHHRYVDTEKDPYSIKKGFWYAHMGWLFKKNKIIDNTVVPDLVNNKAVMLQHKYYGWLVLVVNLLLVLVTGAIVQDFFGAFVMVFLIRLFCTHHLTWFINSWAHMFGSKPYSEEHSAVNNELVAVFTFGEGYHNYHHTFPSDYRNGVRWYQYDPTKVLIWCLSKVGITKNLKKVEFPLIKRKLILEDERRVLEKIKILGQQKWKKVEVRVKKITESLSNKLLEKYKLVLVYKTKKAEERKEIKNKLKKLGHSIKMEYKIWSKICNKVLTKT